MFGNMKILKANINEIQAKAINMASSMGNFQHDFSYDRTISQLSIKTHNPKAVKDDLLRLLADKMPMIIKEKPYFNGFQ